MKEDNDQIEEKTDQLPSQTTDNTILLRDNSLKSKNSSGIEQYLKNQMSIDEKLLISLLMSNKLIPNQSKYSATQLLDIVDNYLDDKGIKKINSIKLANVIKETKCFIKGKTKGIHVYKKINGNIDQNINKIINELTNEINNENKIANEISNKDIDIDKITDVERMGKIYILTSKSNITNKIDLYKIGYTVLCENELLQDYSRCCSSPVILLLIECEHYKECESKMKEMYYDNRTVNENGRKQEWVKGIPLAELIMNYTLLVKTKDISNLKRICESGQVYEKSKRVVEILQNNDIIHINKKYSAQELLCIVNNILKNEDKKEISKMDLAEIIKETKCFEKKKNGNIFYVRIK